MEGLVCRVGVDVSVLGRRRWPCSGLLCPEVGLAMPHPHDWRGLPMAGAGGRGFVVMKRHGWPGQQRAVEGGAVAWWQQGKLDTIWGISGVAMPGSRANTTHVACRTRCGSRFLHHARVYTGMPSDFSANTLCIVTWGTPMLCAMTPRH